MKISRISELGPPARARRLVGRPLTLLAGALVGLAACEGDPTTPPPPPPPPSSAEISIVSFVDESGAELSQTGGEIQASGRIGVVIDFDTGDLAAQSLDLILDAGSGSPETVSCDGFPIQGAVGLRADIQTVQCGIDTGEGVGICQGQSMNARFRNGSYTVTAELTLQDGSMASDEADAPLRIENSMGQGVQAMDIGPRVVSVGGDFPDFGVQDGVAFWGGPRVLTWMVCPVVFDLELADICRIEISARTLDGTGDLDLGNGAGQRASSEAPFMYTAVYRDPDGKPVNEDLVEDDPAGGGHVIGDGATGFRVILCEGTDVTSEFGIQSDVRHLDTTAPGCDDFFFDCEPSIDDMAVGDDASVGGDPDLGFIVDPLYSGGDVSIDGLVDAGVGGSFGVDATVGVFECTDSPCDPLDPDNQTEVAANVLDLDGLGEDDVCPDDETTNGSTALASFDNHCVGDVPDEGGFDAYYLVPTQAADLLGNALGDGDMDDCLVALADGCELDASEAFGIDFTAPDVDEIEPDPAVDPFTWNPVDPGTGDIETFMFEAVDPTLASGDAPSRVLNFDCDAGCDFVQTTWTDSNDNAFTPGCFQTNGAGDTDGDGDIDVTDLTSVMFECEAGVLADESYSVRTVVPDQAIKVVNETVVEQTVIIDKTTPVVQPFDPLPPGIVQTNAGAIQLDIGGTVTDAGGLESVVVQFFNDDDGTGGDCSNITLVPEGTGAGEVDDNTQDVTATADDFLASFVVQNPGVSAMIKYCSVLTAEDEGRLKDGTDNPNTSQQFASTVVDWNP